jgi:hypothetical protein
LVVSREAATWFEIVSSPDSYRLPPFLIVPYSISSILSYYYPALRMLVIFVVASLTSLFCSITSYTYILLFNSRRSSALVVVGHTIMAGLLSIGVPPFIIIVSLYSLSSWFDHVHIRLFASIECYSVSTDTIYVVSFFLLGQLFVFWHTAPVWATKRWNRMIPNKVPSRNVLYSCIS